MTHTVESIIEMLRTSDKAVIRAIVVLNERQTREEQATRNTKYNNGVGVRPCHAYMITAHADFYEKKGYLTPKQINYWRKPYGNKGLFKIGVYAGQLLKVAKEKMENEAMKVV